jgi:hypothetical protein
VLEQKMLPGASDLTYFCSLSTFIVGSTFKVPGSARVGVCGSEVGQRRFINNRKRGSSMGILKEVRFEDVLYVPLEESKIRLPIVGANV